MNSPKGTGKKIEERELVEKTGGIQGEKRIVTDPGDPDTTEQGSLKRRRMRSPDKRRQNPQWKKRPTFFTGQEQEEGTEPKPEPEPETEMKV